MDCILTNCTSMPAPRTRPATRRRDTPAPPNYTRLVTYVAGRDPAAAAREHATRLVAHRYAPPARNRR